MEWRLRTINLILLIKNIRSIILKKPAVLIMPKTKKISNVVVFTSWLIEGLLEPFFASYSVKEGFAS